MPHDTALIATVAAGFGLAFVFGLLAIRLKLPPLVGYLVAGIAVGPFTPGFVADTGLAQQLAEIGVILLMFGVGMHFSVEDLMAVRRIAVPGAIVQISVATVLSAIVAHFWGWPWAAGLVFGLCLSVASTVVLLRALEDRGILDSSDGRIAVGWLIVEDIVTVLVLVILPAIAVPLGGVPAEGMADSGNLVRLVGMTLAKVTAFVVIMIVVGRRAVPWLLERVARIGSRELFTLMVLAVALGIAVGASALFGVSVALGAFFAGIVVNSSDLSHEAAADALPLQDAFSVLFFVAVGMLFDPAILVQKPLEVLMVVLIVLIGKSLGAFGVVLAFGHPVHTALTISASLAQIGEFSFILASLGLSLGLLPPEAQGLVVAGAIITIALNPLVFGIVPRLAQWIARRPRLRQALERRALNEVVTTVQDPSITHHAIVVGFGRVGSVIGRALSDAGVPFIAIEQNRELFESLRARGIKAVYGNAGRPTTLGLAYPEVARQLVVTDPDPYRARAIIELARKANPGIDVIARAHSDEEREYLEKHGARLAVIGERELAMTMARYAVQTCTS